MAFNVFNDIRTWVFEKFKAWFKYVRYWLFTFNGLIVEIEVTKPAAIDAAFPIRRHFLPPHTIAKIDRSPFLEDVTSYMHS